jgi:hypothetical protein
MWNRFVFSNSSTTNPITIVKNNCVLGFPVTQYDTTRLSHALYNSIRILCKKLTGGTTNGLFDIDDAPFTMELCGSASERERERCTRKKKKVKKKFFFWYVKRCAIIGMSTRMKILSLTFVFFSFSLESRVWRDI